MNENNPIIQKIISADPSTYIVFFVRECSYCQSALNLLRKKNIPYKGYNIDNIKDGMKGLLMVLRKNADLLNFDLDHKTKPIIFLNGKFIGGADDLSKKIGK